MTDTIEQPKLPAPDPGIYPGVPFATYAAWDAVNPSLAKQGRVSMKHLRDAQLLPVRPPTDAMTFGSAGHCCVFEPDEFPARYVLWNGGDRRGKAWDEFCAANRGRVALRADTYRACLAIRDAVRSHPAAAKYLAGAGAHVESSLVWDDPGTGVRCKGRPDYVTADAIVDLKLTHSLDERDVQRTVANFGYHISLAAYQSGWMNRTGGEIRPAVLIFAEMARPYDVVVRPVPDEVMIRGFDLWVDLLGRIRDCRASGEWPGIASGEVPLALPAWEMGGEDELELTLDGEALGL